MAAAIGGMCSTAMAGVIPVHSARIAQVADSGTAPSTLALAIVLPGLVLLAGVLLIGLTRQATARRHLARALSESRDHFRILFEETPRPICLVDLFDHRCLAVNRAAVDKYGYSHEEFLELSFTALQIGRGTASGDVPDPADSTARHRTRQGVEIMVDLVRHPVQFEGHSAEMIVVTDLTERERDREAFQLSRQQLDAMINNIPDMVWLKDTELRYVALNKATLRSSGLRQDQVIGRTDQQLWSSELAERYSAQDRLALSSGQRQTVEEAIPSGTGTLAWVETISTPYRDSHDKLAGVAGIARDLTERRELERQLVQSQKLEAIGSLAAGVAHEINTPTQYVGDNLRFLENAFADLMGLLAEYDRELEAAGPAVHARAREAARTADLGYLKSEIPRAVSQSLEGISQVAAIVGAVKGFSHPGSPEKSLVDLNRAIDNTVTVSRNEWKYVADLVTSFDPDLPLVPCQPGELQQVVLNLIINAAHAIAERTGAGSQVRGRISVSTSHRDGWIEIRISDTGTGIPEAARAKVFDPFFTTKGVGRGTGQGLAISRSVVVDKHSGTITFETELGHGTTFLIRLPTGSESAPVKVAA